MFQFSKFPRICFPNWPKKSHSSQKIPFHEKQRPLLCIEFLHCVRVSQPDSEHSGSVEWAGRMDDMNNSQSINTQYIPRCDILSILTTISADPPHPQLSFRVTTMCQQSFRLVFICCWLNEICERWHRRMGLIINPQYVPSGRSFLLWLCGWHLWPPSPSFLIKLGKISIAANSVGEFAREPQLGEVIHFSGGRLGRLHSIPRPHPVCLQDKPRVEWVWPPRLAVNTDLQKWSNRGEAKSSTWAPYYLTWPPRPPLALTNTSRGSDRADSSAAGRGPEKLPSPYLDCLNGSRYLGLFD